MVGGDISKTNSVIKRTFTTADAVQGDDEQYDSDFLNVFLYTCTVKTTLLTFFVVKN